VKVDQSILLAKAQVLRRIRKFFERQGYTEVFTSPLLRSPNLDPNIGVFKVEGEQLYLHTSPEHPMKKLLAKERRSIYQLAPVFRNDREDTLHRKAFLMLEWYGVNHTYRDLMDETEALITTLAKGKFGGGPGLQRRRGELEIDLTPPWLRMNVEETFRRWIGASISDLRSEEGLENTFSRVGLDYEPEDTWETKFNMLFVHCIEPRIRGLGKPLFLYDYPVEVGLMAAPHPKDPTLVQRVELFAGDLELMNGYTELTDPKEQLRRWREQWKDPDVDEELLKALPQMGLVAGAALGVERLLMLLWEAEEISQVSLSE